MPAEESLPSPVISPARRRIVLVGMMCGVSLAAIDQMVLATAVATIAGELGDMSQAPWIFTANLLASAASMPIWGKLGDLYGRRRVFLSAIALFIVASLFAAESPSMGWLLVCRALQGLGGGALLTMPYAILADVVPPKERPAYVAFVTVVWTVAGMLGPPLGGLIVDGPGWRWMFYLNVPAALAAFALLQWGYRLPRERLEHRVDFPGAALLFCSVGALILYTSWAGRTLGWISPAALGLLATSGALGWGFVRWEQRAPEPIVELSLLRVQAVWAPLLTTFCYGLGNFAITFLVPLFGLVVRGNGAVEAGLGLMPLTLGLLLSGIVFGRLAAVTQRYRRYALTGLAVYAVGLVLLSTAGPDTPRAVFWGYSFLLGVGSGPLNPVLIASLQNAVEPRHLGVASSLPGFARSVAQTIGSSALGALLGLRFAAHLESDVRSLVGPGTALDGLASSPEAIRALAEPLRGAVVEAYRSALSETFLAMVGLILLSGIAASFMFDPSSRTARAKRENG
jgi:EmrB/QacA subfamily drug resistance transporter